MPVDSQQETNSEKAKGDEVIANNFDSLRRAIVPSESGGQREIAGIVEGSRNTPDTQTILEYIRITYNTRTGQIGSVPDQAREGEFSIIRTQVVKVGETVTFDGERKKYIITPGKYQILLTQPGDMPVIHAYSAAIAGEKDELASEGRRILPERIDPESVKQNGPNITGRFEPWGYSELVDSAAGDLKIRAAIERFNEAYGPTLTDQLFRKVFNSK